MKAIKLFLLSFVYAYKGIRHLIYHGRNLRVQMIVAISTIAGAFYYSFDRVEWMILLLCCGLVLSAEAFNTALELLVDKISPEWNEKAGTIKDVAAAAVFIFSLFAALIGCFLFLPHLFA